MGVHEQLLDYAVQGETPKLCHLHGFIYSLKQSPRTWFVKFNILIIASGLIAYKVDPKVLARRHLLVVLSL